MPTTQIFCTRVMEESSAKIAVDADTINVEILDHTLLREPAIHSEDAPETTAATGTTAPLLRRRCGCEGRRRLEAAVEEDEALFQTFGTATKA
jgi:hypothetical protein